MNFGGKPFLSRSAQATGRSLLLLSLATILAVLLEVDTSKLSIFEVAISEEQLGTATLWSLFVLIVALAVNWAGDFVSLGKWNSFLTEKRVETIFDGGGKIKGRVEFVLDSLEYSARNDKKDQLDNDKLDYVIRIFKELERDLWRYEITAVCYVVIWGFIVPAAFGLYAMYSIVYA